ncbi:integrator complex subunit 6-like [Clytia hemisphaerica]|uniref:VWFA domain-containing protein n=1 Tax=Clytia hemisphaerica TaxID=252671 RepID=A0A7M5U754_9CNID
MVLLVFLIDTSASMNQRTCLGTSYLDLAKGAVESFIKIRARDPVNAKGDRYMLVTYDENSKSVKAGWKGVNLQMFMTELKNLDGFNLSDVGRALKESFDLLNINRLHMGLDNYGMGRNPFYLEPAIILLLTDGCAPMDPNGMIKEISIPTHDLLPGAELTNELYRWDQRLFTLQMKIPGFAQPLNDKHLANTPEDVPLSTLCDLTGGKLYNIGGYKQLLQSMESIAQKIITPGVVLNFAMHGPDDMIQEDVQDHMKCDENVYLGINELKDGNHINGKISRTGVSDKQLTSLFTDQSNFYNQQHGGMNGFVNGQGILPTPPSINNKNFIKNPNIINGDIEMNQPLKTEGLSTSENLIPETPIRGGEEPENVFSPSSVAQTTAWHNQHRLIYVRKGKGSVCHWPIPESFWPDPAATRIPARNSHPIVKFVCKPVDAVVGNLSYNLPFDKYELEPSPLTQNILERRMANTAWQTFISGSSPDSEIGYPFGYLKASTNFQTVNLFVLPYNYPVILPLLDDLFQVHKCKPSVSWKQCFQEYLQTVPSYYYDPLRHALNSMKAPTNLIPDHMAGALSYSVSTYLKKLKHESKARADRYLQQKKDQDNVPPAEIPRVPQLNDGKLRDFKELLIHKSSSRRKGKSSKTNSGDSKPFDKRKIPKVLAQKLTIETFRNPFVIPYGDIIDHVNRMRLQFFHMSATSSATSDKTLADEEQRHDVAITAMGNFQDHLQQNKSLREVDPSQIRVHTFGNPFKLKQQEQANQAVIAVDEADVNENMPLGANANQRKRSGDIMASLQKGKRKRSETPPPSRKPIGRPNVPPPKPILSNNTKEETEKLLRLLPDHKGVLKDVTGSLDKNSLENSDKDKHSSNVTVSKQLRKLQQIHRNKKGVAVDLTNDNNTDDIEHLDSHSPILSILRTSLEESDERDNDEVSQINERSVIYDDDNSNDSTSTTRTTPSVAATPLSAILSPLLMEDMFRNKSNEQLKTIYQELHTRKVVQIRQSIWQAIRGRKKFSVIEDMVKRLNVSMETKYLFVMNLIYEADRFQHVELENDLKTLLREIQANRND